jgi:5-hydroxyisourate hydrolase
VTISTHVLDAAAGIPASDVAISLDRLDGPAWVPVGTGRTNADGRCPELTDGLDLATATYRLRFESGAYFAARATATFYPFVEVTFAVSDAGAHHHVPLLLSPFAYSTYRGS